MICLSIVQELEIGMELVEKLNKHPIFLLTETQSPNRYLIWGTAHMVALVLKRGNL